MIRHRNTFTPRELFSRMQGAWFEPRQGYMWQENTGVTPTTTGGQTIGKLVDLSADRVASQATAANRPNLQFNGNLPLIRHADSTDVLAAIMPAINVRRNLLTWSEDFSNAVWSKGNIALTKNSITNTGTISVYAYQTLLNINKSKCYAAIDAKYVSARYMQLTICSGLSTRYAALFDLISGNFVESASTSGSMSEVEWEITATSDGYYRIGIAGKTSDVTWYFVFQITDSYPVSRNHDLDLIGATNNVSTSIRNAYFSDYGDKYYSYQKITDWTSEQYSSAGSVYFGTPQGMSCLHNQSIGTSYNLPAPQTDIYGTVITPARLAPPLEQRLALYMHRLAGLSDADFFWQEDYGPDVVTNGGFDTDSAWIKGMGWSISGGVASVAQNSFAQNLTQGCLTAGKVYIITFTITQAANVYGGIRITLDGGTTFSAYYKTPGTYSFTAAATTSMLIFQSLYADISVDNISVREVLDGQVGQLLADDNDTILLRA